MKFRGTMILSIVAIGLLAFVYFYEIPGEKKREEAQAKAQKALDVKADSISSLEIVRPGKETLKVEKANGVWSLTSPLKTRADDGEVGSLTWQLADLSFTQVASETPINLAPFGLVTPEIKITFETNGAKKTIFFGANTPIGNDVYLQIGGEKRVLVVSKSAKSAFEKEAIDLRDKKVLAFDQANLVGFEVATGERKLAFEKSNNDWSLKAPIVADASDDRVQAVLDQLSTLQAEEFIPEPAAIAQNLGAPQYTFTLIFGGKEPSRKKIDFFYKKGETKAIAHPEGDAWYYRVSYDILAEAGRDAGYFRESRVVRFDRFDLSEIFIQSGVKATPITLVKDEKGDWLIKEPENAKGKALASNVYDFIDNLENLRADQFVDNPPSDSEMELNHTPAVILYGKTPDGKGKKELARLVIGKKLDPLRYARGKGSQVFFISATFPMPKGPQTFTETGSEPKPSDVTPAAQ